MTRYRLLLLLYPSSFRAEYGREMSDLMARRLQTAGTFGGRVAVWFDAFWVIHSRNDFKKAVRAMIEAALDEREGKKPRDVEL